MDFLVVLSQVLSITVGIGLSFWILKLAVASYIFSKKKEEINGLHARVSILKLHLKGKIKKKANRIERVLRKDREVLSILRPNLETLTKLDFNNKADYQIAVNLFLEITLNLAEHIKMKHKNLLKDEIASANKSQVVLSANEETKAKCEKIIKYDKANMQIILDICKTTDEVILKIFEYNELASFENSQAHIKDIPERIPLEHLELLNDLLAESELKPLTSDFPVLEKNLFDGGSENAA